MLCTRMRLVERRFNNENTPGTNNIGLNSGITHRIGSNFMNAEGFPPTSSSSTMGVIQRPCILRNLEGFMDSNGELNTPRTLFDRSRKSSEKEKPPLVIVSLDLPDGIKTLAPHDIKRDPKRIPCFSEQLKEFKRTQSHYDGPKTTKTNTTSSDDTLMIRGFDILNKEKSDSDTNSQNNSNRGGAGAGNGGGGNSDQNDMDEDNDDLYGSIYFWNKPIIHESSGNLIPRELQVQLTDCCQCMHDVNSMRRDFKSFGKLFSENSDDLPEDLLPILKQHDIDQQKQQQQEQQQQQQHYHHHQQRPYFNNSSNNSNNNNSNNNMQDSRYLTVNNSGRIEPYQAYKPPYVQYTRMLFRRTPSPRTRQVINVNVTMNTKKIKK